MFLLRFTLFFGVAIVLTVIITQVIVPLWREQPLFPWFNKTFKKLDAEKRAVAEERMKKKMEKSIGKSNKS